MAKYKGKVHLRRPERDEARRLYVEAPPGHDITINELAERYGYTPNAMAAISAKEGWKRLRTEFRARVDAERQKARMEFAVGAAAEFDEQSLQVARAALGRAAKFLTEEGRQTGNDRRGNPVSVPALRTGDLLNIANTMRVLQQVVHAAVGQPDERLNQPGVKGKGMVSWADVMRLSQQMEALTIEHDPDGDTTH